MRTRIVVPCYNEATRLDVPAFDKFLAATRDVGFILVNDGSTDGTLAVLGGIEARWPTRVEVIDQQPNAGKAEAVRVGMLAAFSGGSEYAGYFDGDLATPLDAIEEFVGALDRNPRGEGFLGLAELAVQGFAKRAGGGRQQHPVLRALGPGE